MRKSQFIANVSGKIIDKNYEIINNIIIYTNDALGH